MILLEHEAENILEATGLFVPERFLAQTPAEAAEGARMIAGKVAVKVQIPAGGRMKAGGIQLAESPEEAYAAAETLLGATIRGFPVDTVQVQEWKTLNHKVFVSAFYDAAERSAVLLASRDAGADIEDSEGHFVQQPFSTLEPFSKAQGRHIAEQMGFYGQYKTSLGYVIARIANTFLQSDALLLEINPLIQDEAGFWWVVDAHFEIDDDALYRQSDLLAQASRSIAVANRKSTFEQRAQEIDSADHRGVAGRLIPFDGTLGLLIGGGGASLTIMDAVLDAGLQPANYCEIGGNPSVWKIKELTKLILSQPQVMRLAVIMNVVSNTRVDLVARGVIKGILELGYQPREVLAAFRIPGSWEDEGQAILEHYGIPYYGRETSIDEVVAAI